MEEDGYNNKYDALANTIKIEDISPDEGEQDILRRLKNNDPTFDKLWICDRYHKNLTTSLPSFSPYLIPTHNIPYTVHPQFVPLVHI